MKKIDWQVSYTHCLSPNQENFGDANIQILPVNHVRLKEKSFLMTRFRLMVPLTAQDMQKKSAGSQDARRGSTNIPN